MHKSTAHKNAPAQKWALPAKQARSQATQARILEAAESIFAEYGYEGARISDIAHNAGCSVGAVYFRFKDKDALFFAIAERFASDIRANLPQLLLSDMQSNTATVIDVFVQQTAKQFRSHRGLFRAIVERGFDHSHAMSVIFAIREEMHSVLEQSLRKEIPAQDLEFTVRVMTQIVYGFLLTGILNKSAPTKINDKKTVSELSCALRAYVREAGRKP